MPRVIGMTQKAIDVKSDGISRTPLSLDEFLSQCSPDAADMFRNALNSTLTKDFSVYWGATSFSIRAHIATDQREYASFLYGWIPNILEIFLKNLPFEETELMSFRQELLKFGIFKEAGNWTLRATIDGQTKQKAEDVYNFALSKVMERLKINRSRIPAQDHLNARVED